ncbi:MAG: hypothetical protein ACT4P1_03485 [Sporichthyaceae bacterium]
MAAGLLAGAVLAGGGAATANQLLADDHPGGDEITPLGEEITLSRTGSASVDLGPRSAGATHIDLKFTCLSRGEFRFSDGASVKCSEADVAAGSDPTSTYQIKLRPGENTTRIETDDRARWQVTVTYAAVDMTDWKINRSGQTYGVENERGIPDLIAVEATNGQLGYADARQINGVLPTSRAEAEQFARTEMITVRVPVYEVDGETQIGEFLVTRSAAEQKAIDANRSATMIERPAAPPREPVLP